MVTWAVFEITGTGKRFRYFNTHFAHRDVDETARLKSAMLIACRIGLLDAEEAVILTGDFNAPAGGAVHQILAQHMQDAWLAAATRTGPEGTFHGFTGKPRPGRIDWILYRAPWKVLSAETITDRKAGVFPSDHFPVLAVFEMP
jgi:endonuclease/exonuclease/phosphatase family metal-dependent hydrolase